MPTLRPTWISATVAAAAALLLAGCDTRSDSHANAPGSPGNNATQAAVPQAPDGPPGGPSGVAGSLPHTGSSGGDVMPGTTGSSGVVDATGRSQTPQPGSGLNGGLGNGSGLTGSFPGTGTAGAEGGSTAMGNNSGSSTPATTNSGSSNATSASQVGQR